MSIVRYYNLLREAAEASEAEDDFDLRSEDTASWLAFRALQRANAEAQIRLIAHIIAHPELVEQIHAQTPT